MDEARRFLRFVTPGLVFLSEVLVLLWVTEPDLVYVVLKACGEDAGGGLLVVTLLVSGGIGSVFGAIHHELHWLGGSGVANHVPFIEALRKRNTIRLLDRRSGDPISGSQPSRFQAWAMVTGLWHGRLAGKDSVLRGADPRATSLVDLMHSSGTARATSLVDLMHSSGTARVASGAAWIAALMVLAHTCRFDLSLPVVVRFVIGNALAISCLLLYHYGYRRTGRSVKLVVEQVLDRALTQESRAKGAPIDVFVDLQ